ncbi:MAG: hypothetical protein A2847_01975 [Candidatus Sungbacteria bacterium RIFCSPHIGHO2_01_FULL_50_25]|uniref:Uncharacterized protein n=1 Tax=Candidatus Sungbacteria bacterium RIFCSPHIGHO2_01_FULL_50_25 TaxID=1802265 RepID=A0A1G2KBV5_9BACT|nr:MAG: hypothetical protein A2847_01975 [Candidatus Sungbacteria bacterium RIFCSPHIGHO2_01_FULL_50_25]
MTSTREKKRYIIGGMGHLVQTAAIGSFLFALPFFAGAQISFPQLEPPASITAVPSSPAPGEKVILQAVTPIFNKDTTFFEWTINGQFRSDLSGRGKYSAEITAGGIGSAISVSVRATALDKQVATMSATIRVSDLSLVWHADTHVPAWFTGKALAVPGSTVYVTALPEIASGGKMIDPKNLVYQWSLGDEKKFASGIGKQSIGIQTSKIPNGSHWVRVSIEDLGKTVKKEGSLFIINRNPLVSVYRYSPVGGTEYRSAHTLIHAAKGELIDLVAEPFFFPGGRKNIAYAWKVGGTSIEPAAQNPQFLTLKTEGIQAVSLSVSATASSLKNAFLLPVIKSLTIFIQ